MNILDKIRRIPITSQLVLLITSILLAITLKILQISIYYDKFTGLYQDGFATKLLGAGFYILLIIAAAIAASTAVGIAPFHKRISKSKPLILGYCLFFVAVMFMVEGITGFYNHVTFLISNARLSDAMPIMEKIVGYIPFVTDALCVLCAYSFYKMAMESFLDDGVPPKSLMSSALPAVWGSFMLLQVLIFTTDKLYIQHDNEQILFSVLNVTYLYFVAKQFMDPKYRRQKTLFVLIVEIVYASVAFAIIVPYMILMLFGVKDAMPSMPYFALFGIAIYSVASMLHYLLSASVLQTRRERVSRAVSSEFLG